MQSLKKIHAWAQMQNPLSRIQNVFHMKWAESFVIFEIYVRILSLKHHYFQFYQRKVPCFSSIREISVRLTIIFP